MSAAAFVLAINVSVAALFATAFAVVAINARMATGARWLALAYGAGAVNVGLELILPFQGDSHLVELGIFAAFLFALAFSVVGLARNYRVEPPWRLLGVLVGASLVDIAVIVDLDRGIFWRAFFYQLPYALVQLLGVLVVLRSGRRQALDLALLLINVLGSLQFLGKPFLAGMLGSGASAQLYIGTNYAAISQAVGAVLLIANGVVMLVIILRDTMTEMRAQSATDPLSGLLNRRGFEESAEKLIATARRHGAPVSLIVADLDHFKAINDNHGHAVGDGVIRRFATTLSTAAELGAATVTGVILGRLGGEEFAALAPDSGVNTAVLFAERVRSQFGMPTASDSVPGLLPTASFGVAQLGDGEGLYDVMRRADAALYDAKRSGRDRICVAESNIIPVARAALPQARRRALRH
tara:strand:- start:32035 stop:33267 length:1233 start_codon:yes stop_codon:yes gene_type:complete